MSWQRITRSEVEQLIAKDLADSTKDERDFFARVAISLVKWQQSPWGDDGGGFWVVAVSGDQALWYNDIEEGFNVSRFKLPGRIPTEEYWANQDSLKHALIKLRGDSRGEEKA